MNDDLVGRTVSHYRITERLGGGGMGVVYRAEDSRLKREVALKFLSPVLTRDDVARERFAREAQAASALDHPSICTIHDVDETEDGQLFIAMTLYEGKTLRERLDEGPMDMQESLRIAGQVAAGLEQAHEHGLVHRDIKPSNLILTPTGVKILDFGVAKLTDRTDLTSPGVMTGTVTYMAPEQIEGGSINGRADVWALGVVLYEMLSGRNPFDRDRLEAVVSAILTLEPGPLGKTAGTPPGIDALLVDALRKDPDRRLDSARAFLDRIEALTPSTPAPASAGSKKAVIAALTVAVLAVGAAAMFAYQGRGRAAREAARESLPGIETLAAEGRYPDAYPLAVEATRRLADDTTAARLLADVMDVIHVTSDPLGARVELVPIGPNGTSLDPVPAGVTPVHSFHVPRGDYFVRVVRDGYVPAERVVSSALLRREALIAGGPTAITLDVTLLPADAAPGDMVLVSGGPYELVSHAAPRDLTAELDPFYIDRFEVSNAQYLEFIRAGGYANPEYWEAPFLQDGHVLSFPDAMALFVDRSGLPGPRGWTGQQYPEDRADHPVVGVTWYEATAYARFVGKQLPSLFQWEKSARAGRIARGEGVIMPWGYEGPGEGMEERAAFAGTGTTRVDRYPFGISPFGAYAMAGNVREMTRTGAPGGHIATGGSWQDPPYVFTAIGVYDDLFAASDLGFRCVRPVSPESGRTGQDYIDLTLRTPVYEPVDEPTFRNLLTHYRYDRRPLNAEVIERTEDPDWVLEKLAWDGPGGDRVLGYLFLPRQAAPPYQTLVYIPGVDAFFSQTARQAAEWALGPIVRGGRAVFAPVLRGMRERAFEPGYTMPDPPSVAFRDLVVQHATEMRTGMDYLETRNDIDADRIAYVGLSFGAGSRLVLAGTDDRFKAIVFMGAGIDERVMPTLPEASNVNFAPYLGRPILMLNGTTDEEHPWLTRALPLWNLLREPKELVLLEGAGHVPPVEGRIPAIVDFLDRHLGPVR